MSRKRSSVPLKENALGYYMRYPIETCLAYYMGYKKIDPSYSGYYYKELIKFKDMWDANIGAYRDNILMFVLLVPFDDALSGNPGERPFGIPIRSDEAGPGFQEILEGDGGEGEELPTE